MKSIIAYTAHLNGHAPYIQMDEGQVVNVKHTLNPHNATVFTSETHALEWLETNITEWLNYEVLNGEVLEQHKEQFDEWFADGMIVGSVPLLNKERAIMFDETKHTFEDVLEWMWWQTTNKDGERSVRQPVYNSWSSAIYKFKDSIFNRFQKYHNITYTEQYFTMEISISKKTKFKAFKKELNYILDTYELTYIQECEGYTGIEIDMLTDDLSESGSLSLLVVDREKDLWAVSMTSWGSDYEKIAPCSLKECFVKIKDRGYTYK